MAASKKHLWYPVLLLALVSSAAFAAVAAGSLAATVPSLPGRTVVTDTSLMQYGELSGRLLVEKVSTFWPPQDITVFSPLAGQPVMITRQGEQSLSGPPNLITTVADANGSLKVELPAASDYVLTVNEPRFSASVPFGIRPNETTGVELTFRRLAHRVVFQEYRDAHATGLSGVAGGDLFLRIDSRSSFVKVRETVTLEVLAGSSALMAAAPKASGFHRVMARVVSESLSGGSVFLEVRPESELRVGATADFLVVVYQANYAVVVGRH